MNKLLATSIDFNSIQSFNLPTGNIDLLKQLQLRSCRTFMRRQMRALSRTFSAFRTSVPRLTRSHSTRSTRARLRCQGTGQSVDRVLSHRMQSIRAVQLGHFKDCTSHLRCATRVRSGADPLHILLG